MYPEETKLSRPSLPSQVLPPTERLSRRRQVRLFGRLFSSFLFVLLLVLGVLYFSLDPFRLPTGLKVEGNSLIDAEAFRSLDGLSTKSSLLFLDKGKLSAEVLSDTDGVLSSFALEGNLFSLTAEVEEVVPLFKDEEDNLYFDNGMTLPQYEEKLRQSGFSETDVTNILSRINENFSSFLLPHGPLSMTGNWKTLFSERENFSSFQGTSFSFFSGKGDITLLGIEFPYCTTADFGSVSNVLIEEKETSNLFLIKEVPVSSLGTFLSKESIPEMSSNLQRLWEEGLPEETYSFADAPDVSYPCYSLVYQE